MLTSCSSLFEKKERLEFKSFSDGWNRICLSGDGKGRLKYGKNRYSFSYEMLLKKKLEKWLIGMNFPMHGEEVLSVSFSNIFKTEEADVKGGFIDRIYSDLEIKKGGKKTKQLLDSLFLDIGNFLAIYNSNILENKRYRIIENKSSSGSVRKKHKKQFSWSIEDSGIFRITMSEHDKHFVQFNFYNSKSFSNRVDIKLMNQGQSDTEKDLIELNLAIITCNSGH
jgi:hypothetical protein